MQGDDLDIYVFISRSILGTDGSPFSMSAAAQYLVMVPNSATNCIYI